MRVCQALSYSRHLLTTKPLAIQVVVSCDESMSQHAYLIHVNLSPVLIQAQFRNVVSVPD